MNRTFSPTLQARGFAWLTLRSSQQTLFLLVANVLPFVAVFLTTGIVQILYLFVLLDIGFIYLASKKVTKVSAWYALLHPVGTLVLAYAVAESAIKATWSGGIRWRGTFYALEQDMPEPKAE